MPKRVLHRTWWIEHLNELIVIVGAIVILAGVFAGVLRVWQTAEEAHHAICALRHEREQAIIDAKKFLSEHPQGIPGITRADIERSIGTQEQTVRAFRFADC